MTALTLTAPPEMMRTAEISPCGAYRWTLGRVWEGMGLWNLVCMLNPSSADDRVDDPTIRRLIAWHQRWGYGAFLVVNLYPLRSPRPDEVREWCPDFCASAAADVERYAPAMMDNERHIVRAARKCSGALVAWGAGAWDAAVIVMAVKAIRHGFDSDGRPGARMSCLGRTASGAPIHPLARGKHRVPDDVELQPWAPRA